MAIFDSNININKLIQITTGGVQVATFAEIRDALITSFKKIYGNDIDVNSATADGQWLNEVALIINNCLLCVKNSYDMLDPASATGNFLDILCSYNNIQRRNETNSIAQLWVKNISGIVQNDVKSLTFIDKNGTEWEWYNTKSALQSEGYETKWDIGEVQLLQNVMCKMLGPVEALGTHIPLNIANFDTISQSNSGFINQAIEFGKWKVYQESDAVIGDKQETDEALRSRRIQSLGNQSVSVLSGLEGALLNIDAIKDVWIYNAKEGKTMEDETIVPQHYIYVCIRYKENLTDNNKSSFDSIIANTIYNKLTPGIPTKEFQNTQGVGIGGNSKEYAIHKSNNITYNVYWKDCTPYVFGTNATTTTIDGVQIKYGIKIDLQTVSNLFDYSTETTIHTATTETEKNIVTKLLNLFDNIELGQNLVANDISLTVQQSDLFKNGLPTFFVTNTTINGATNGILTLPNTYTKFDENKIFFKIVKTNSNYSTGTIYIGE